MEFTVTELREAFQERYSGLVASGEIDPADAERLMNDDALCECFAKARPDLDQCLQQIEASFRWRCQDKINTLTIDSFPLESLQKGSVYFHSEDREGHPIMYFRIQDCTKTTPEELRLIRQFIGWLMDKKHKRDPTRQIAVLFDMTNAGLSNLNFDLVRFVVRAFQVYYPKFLGYLFVYEMPWVLSAAWKVIKSWLDKESQKKIVFLKRANVQEYIAPDRLWAHMGGSDDFQYQYSPGALADDANSTEEFSDVKHNNESEHHDAEQPPQSPQSPQQQQQQSLNIRQRSGATRWSNGSSPPASTPAADDAGGGAPASSYIGRYMSISPADRVVFRLAAGASEAQRSLTLTSTSQQAALVFKVKTTCPADYKVKPSCGLLDPAASVPVVVTYRPASVPTQPLARTDKFQILATPVAAGLSKDAAQEALKAAPPEAVMEHRLLCRVELPEAATHPPEEQQLAALRAEVSRLSSMVGRMSAQHSQRLAYARYSVLLLAVLLLCLVFLLGWSFGRSANQLVLPPSSATQTSPPSSSLSASGEL